MTQLVLLFRISQFLLWFDDITVTLPKSIFSAHLQCLYCTADYEGSCCRQVQACTHIPYVRHATSLYLHTRTCTVSPSALRTALPETSLRKAFLA